MSRATDRTLESKRPSDCTLTTAEPLKPVLARGGVASCFEVPFASMHSWRRLTFPAISLLPAPPAFRGGTGVRPGSLLNSPHGNNFRPKWLGLVLERSSGLHVSRLKLMLDDRRGWSAPVNRRKADGSYRVISGGSGRSCTRILPNPDVARAVAKSQKERAIDVTAAGEAEQGSIDTSVKDGRGSAQDSLNPQSNEQPIALTEFVQTGRCAEVTTDHADGKIARTRSLCLPACLDHAAATLREAATENASLIARFDSLRERLRHSQLQLAVLGQFKRGKSTFINALLGAPLLPMAVVPLTAVPIFISWRSSPSVCVRFANDRPTEDFPADNPDAIREFLFRFVAEEANPKNGLRVDRVEVFYPAPVLADSTVLIDTPGVGSTFRHNTEAALQVLAECDAAVFVVSPDPPITEAELEYLRHLNSKVAKILFIMNKADYVRIEERARLVDFFRDVLTQNGLWSSGSTIFSVSARDALDGKRLGNRNEIDSSGLGAIEDYLRRYLAAEKTETLTRAISRKAEDILAETAASLDLRMKTLEMPLDELSSKSQLFEQALKSIEGQRRTVDDLLAGEQRRLLVDLRSRADRLYEDVCAELSKVIDRELPAAWSPRWIEGVQSVLGAAIETVFDAARERFINSFAAAANSAFSAHERRLEELINDVRRAAANIFETEFYRSSEDSSFELTNDPYWVTRHVQETLMPDPRKIIDHLLPWEQRRSRLRARLIKQTNELVRRNVGNLHWAILQSLNDTFRKARSRFEERLDDAMGATKTVILAAMERRRAQASEVESEIARLAALNKALVSYRTEITAAASRDGSIRGAAEGPVLYSDMSSVKC
jgi:GTP-binding protein EngB required for normal cell division